jgi:hypothetical protein
MMNKLLYFFIFMMTVLSACQKSPECLNGRTYESGDCNCAVGYEGENCDTLTIAKFLGSYLAANAPINIAQSSLYTITVLKDSLELNTVRFKADGYQYATIPVINFTGIASGDHIMIPNQNIVSPNADLNQNGKIEGEACAEIRDNQKVLRVNLKIQYKTITNTYQQYIWQKL